MSIRIELGRFGGVEVLEKVQSSLGEVADGEVKVAIHAVGVNRADVLLRKGAYHGAKLPAVPGLEASGVVVESRADLPVGARVLVFQSSQGLYATDVVVPAKWVVQIPDRVSFEQAACLPVNWLTAWYSIHSLLRLKKGESILICAAASGLGLAAIQIAKELGAQVIAGASRLEKLIVAHQAGADQVFRYSAENLEREVMRLTEGKGVDTVLEIVGAEIFAKSLKVIRPFGRVVSAANVTLGDSLINTRDFYPKNASIFGFQYGGLLGSGRYDPRADLSTILKGVEGGVFRPRIEEHFPLTEAAKAQSLLESRDVKGKVILTVPRDMEGLCLL